MHRAESAGRTEPSQVSHVSQSGSGAGRLSLAQRRRQLIEAARRVFAERGFRGATTRRIATAAGVTEALIFQHFPDKDSLYAAILDEGTSEAHREAWLDQIEACHGSCDDETVIRMLYEGIIALHQRDPDLMRLMVFSALEEHPLSRHMHSRSTRLYRFLETFITAGQRAGRFKAGSPAFLARAALALPVYYILQQHLFKTPWPPVEAAEVVESGVRFTLAGLRGEHLPAGQHAAPGSPGSNEVRS
jgi:TetR/AcrR family transcriptional regulator